MPSTLRFVMILLLCGPSLPSLAGTKIESRDRMGTARYRTFAFEPGTPARRPEFQALIETEIERGLEANHMTRVFGEAELHVVTHVLVDRHGLVELDGDDYLEYWSGVNSVNAFDLQAGTLIVDLVDVAQQRTVWRGVASMTVGGSSKKMQQKIEKLIEKLLRRLPAP